MLPNTPNNTVLKPKNIGQHSSGPTQINNILNNSRTIKCDGYELIIDANNNVNVRFYGIENLNRSKIGIINPNLKIIGIEIGEGVENIGDGTFEEMGIIKLKLDNGLKFIGDNAFKGNNIVGNNEGKTLVIPESVVKVGNGTFEGNQYLGRVMIHEKTIIGDKSFPDDCKIDTYTLSEDGKIITVDIGSYGAYTMIIDLEKGIRSLKIKDGITDIWPNEFNGLDINGLVEIPNSVRTIWFGAFLMNPDLNSIRVNKKTEIQPNSLPKGCRIIYR